MMRRALRLAAVSVSLATPAVPATAASPWAFFTGPSPVAVAPSAAPAHGEQGLLCRSAIRQAEFGSGLPPHLLGAIAHVESGRADPVTGRFSPWPWTVNAEGRGNFFDTKEQAVAFARGLRARGVMSFDVGCLQINMMHHPDAFASLEEAFDPVANARYAVKFLTQLKDQTGSWDTATADYHSATPELGNPYRGLVVAAMAAEARSPDGDGTLPQLAGAAAGGAASIVAALRSLPTRPGPMMIMAHAPGGAILPLAGMRLPGGVPMASASGAAGGGMIGRGLDSYRMRPVAVAAPRLLAAR